VSRRDMTGHFRDSRTGRPTGGVSGIFSGTL
jgi:hypothetical protein